MLRTEFTLNEVGNEVYFSKRKSCCGCLWRQLLRKAAEAEQNARDFLLLYLEKLRTSFTQCFCTWRFQLDMVFQEMKKVAEKIIEERSPICQE